jgi:hypothetical protein
MFYAAPNTRRTKTVMKRSTVMKTNTRQDWNPDLNKDSVGSIAVLASGLLIVLFAAATSTLAAPPRNNQAASYRELTDGRIIVTATRLKPNAVQTAARPDKIDGLAKRFTFGKRNAV